jgi:hypothetical protein
MKKSIKAALLSGLVFPGLGYFAVKRPLRGGVVLALSAVSLVYLVNKAVQQASLLMDKMTSGELPADLQSLAASASTGADTTLSTLASIVLLACWLFSMVDGYRIGRSEDQQTPAAKQ